MPWKLILAGYAVASLITFAAYGLDKHAAKRRRRRVPEARLHLLELLGGFPGALAGQTVFRHKRRKRSYLVRFWLIVVVHVAAWTTWWLVA